MLKENFIFLGSSLLSVGVLDSMYSQNIVPKIIITNIDKPAGRDLEITESEVSKWAKAKNLQREKNLEEEIILLKPNSLKSQVEIEKIKILLDEERIKFALVASYGKILSQEFLNLFKRGVINIHPSDLPLYRGASPIESQILDGYTDIVVSIMQMNAKMDEGDIWYKESLGIDFKKENLNIDMLEYEIGYFGGATFSKVINKIIDEEIESKAQDSDTASYTRKFTKVDGDVTSDMTNINELKDKIKAINLELNQFEIIGENQELKILNLELNHLMENLYKKYISFTPWPSVYYMTDINGKSKRVKISKMSFDEINQIYKIDKIIPESKKEVEYKN
jgi:methionyl-tRNA formyltransferase